MLIFNQTNSSNSDKLLPTINYIDKHSIQTINNILKIIWNN